MSSRLLLTMLLNLLAVTAPAATIHVPADQPTIQQAIVVAANGDLILVSPGTYFERIDYLGKAISIQSTDGPVQTIIDGGNAGSVVTFQTAEGSQSVLTGFTLQHGNGPFGGGVNTHGTSPTIRQNIFQDNGQFSAGRGSGVGGDLASPLVQGNLFLNNSCDMQFLSGVVSFSNTSSPRILDNIFYGNPCQAINMILPEGSSPFTAGNTIVQNRVGIRVSAQVQISNQIYVNNILVGNDIGLQLVLINPNNEPTWTNNLVFKSTTANYSGIADKTGINGNISISPMFLSEVTFQLRSDSPAIDAGTSFFPLWPTDFAGNRRIVDGNGDAVALPDMGAREFNPQTSRETDQSAHEEWDRLAHPNRFTARKP